MLITISHMHLISMLQMQDCLCQWLIPRNGDQGPNDFWLVYIYSNLTSSTDFCLFCNPEGIAKLERIRTDCRGFYYQLLWNLYQDVSAHCCKYQTLQPALLELGFVESGRHPCVIIQKMLLMVTQMVDGKEQKLAIMLTIYVANLHRHSLSQSLRTSVSLSLGFIYDW